MWKIFHFWSQVAWTYKQIKSVLRLHGPIWTVMIINFENISLLVSGCMDLLVNKKVCSGCMDLIGLPFCAEVNGHDMINICAQVAQTSKIAILCSGHMDLYDCHFVLRFHGPIWLPFCAQVTWTYMISIMICILHSGHMDLFCMCELTAHRDFGFAILHSGHMDLYNCHFVLRSHGPIWLLVVLRLHRPIWLAFSI